MQRRFRLQIIRQSQTQIVPISCVGADLTSLTCQHKPSTTSVLSFSNWKGGEWSSLVDSLQTLNRMHDLHGRPNFIQWQWHSLVKICYNIAISVGNTHFMDLYRHKYCDIIPQTFNPDLGRWDGHQNVMITG